MTQYSRDSFHVTVTAPIQELSFADSFWRAINIRELEKVQMFSEFGLFIRGR